VGEGMLVFLFWLRRVKGHGPLGRARVGATANKSGAGERRASQAEPGRP